MCDLKKCDSGTLYKIDNSGLMNVALVSEVDEALLWHRRLGHVCSRALRPLGHKGKFDANECDTCIRSRHLIAPYSRRSNYALEILFRIHSDICGPFPKGFFDELYYCIIVDEASRKSFLQLMKTKDEVMWNRTR